MKNCWQATLTSELYSYPSFVRLYSIPVAVRRISRNVSRRMVRCHEETPSTEICSFNLYHLAVASDFELPPSPFNFFSDPARTPDQKAQHVAKGQHPEIPL